MPCALSPFYSTGPFVDCDHRRRNGMENDSSFIRDGGDSGTGCGSINHGGVICMDCIQGGSNEII